jgi:hypothetical protein
MTENRTALYNVAPPFVGSAENPTYKRGEAVNIPRRDN